MSDPLQPAGTQDGETWSPLSLQFKVYNPAEKDRDANWRPVETELHLLFKDVLSPNL